MCDCPDTQAIALRIVHRAGIDRRAAIAAEGVKALVAAFGRLEIDLGCAAQQHEMLGRCRDVDAKRRSGKRLAISAVADVERIGIDLRLEGDLAAMAVSIDFHTSFPLSGWIVRGAIVDEAKARILAALALVDGS